MKTLARKTQKNALIVIDLVVGIIIMLGAVIIMPISVFSADSSLLTNAYVWCFVIIGMLFFGSIGFFCFARPFFLFRKLPDIQAETDGTYLYIHSTKEARIPLAEMEGAYLDSEIPYILGRDFVIHLLSEQYGKVIIKVPRYGKYKLHFISRAKDVPFTIAAIAENKLDDLEA